MGMSQFCIFETHIIITLCQQGLNFLFHRYTILIFHSFGALLPFVGIVLRAYNDAYS